MSAETNMIEFEPKPCAEQPVYDHISVQFADDSCMKVTGARVAMNGKIVELVPKEAEPVMSAEEVREACAKLCETTPLTLARSEHPSETHARQVTEAGCRGALAEAIRSLDIGMGSQSRIVEPSEEQISAGEMRYLELMYPGVRDFSSNPEFRRVVIAVYKAMIPT